MKVLITGGAGYIGTELVQKLLPMPEIGEIIVYDNLSRNNYNLFLGQSPYQNNEKLRFVEGELLDSRTLKANLKDVDIVYHLAAKVTTPFSNIDPHIFEQVNHWGTAELVDAVEGAGVKHIVFLSSASIYGSCKNAVDEECEPNPRTFYGISKLRAEGHILRLNSNMRIHILRCGNVFGFSPSMRFDAVINKFVFQTNFQKKIQIHGDGEQERPFIHVSKVAQGLAELPFSDFPSGVYNLVEHNLKVLDIVDVLKTAVPDLEFLMVNQHLNLRSIKIKPNEQLNSLFAEKVKFDSFREEIEDFLSHFTF